jgi:DNA-binding transcriptional ArsR family regulator
MVKKSPNTKTGDLIALFKLLADSNRYHCVALLMRAKSGESVGVLAELLNMSHSSVSHLLAALHDAGIVAYRKAGREVCYMMAKTPQAKRATRLMRVD